VTKAIYNPETVKLKVQHLTCLQKTKQYGNIETSSETKNGLSTVSDCLSILSTVNRMLALLSSVFNLLLTVRRVFVRSTWRDEGKIQAPACRSSYLNV